MPKYRKLPVVIEARQFHGGLNSAQRRALARWCGGEVVPHTGGGWCMWIPTLEEPMLASPGDWIIRGVKGEFYPCKPDIFATTYEKVEDEI